MCNSNNIQGLLVCFGGFLQKLVPYTASLALLYFLWGVFKLIRAQGDTKMIEEGRRTAFWGVIALFVIACIGGIVLFLQHDIISGVQNDL